MATSRTKAIAFAAILLLVSLGFVTAAATSATSALAPLKRGDPFALERPLSRHGTVLAVFVATTSDGEPQRTGGATVTVTRVDGTPDGLIGAVQTDDKGRALFMLAKGSYRVDVVAGTMTSSKSFDVRHPQRVGVVFDESGGSTWNTVDHKRLEKHGESYTLVARAIRADADGRTPIAGVVVQVYSLKGGERVLVEEKTTGERGNAVFTLHKGRYEVVATLDGETASQRAPMGADMRALFVDDDSGFHAAADKGRPAAARGGR